MPVEVIHLTLLSLLLPFVALSARPIDLKLDAARTGVPINPFIHENAATTGSNLPVDLAFNPDKVFGGKRTWYCDVRRDRARLLRQWVNLTWQIIVERIPKARLVELSPRED